MKMTQSCCMVPHPNKAAVACTDGKCRHWPYPSEVQGAMQAAAQQPEELADMDVVEERSVRSPSAHDLTPEA